MEDIMKLCDVVRETAFAIHRYHKHGHLEKAYVLSQSGQGVGTGGFASALLSIFAFLAPFRG